jgi:translation initiation factor 1
LTRKDARLVYTSDPEEARRLRREGAPSAVRDRPPGDQTIQVTIDRKKRNGKAVTVASGFELTPDSLGALARRLKQRCGAGGTTRESEIEVQGEHRDAVADELARSGFRVRP